MSVKNPIIRFMLKWFDGHPERWCRNTLYRNAFGEACSTSEDAVQTCLVGAQYVALHRFPGRDASDPLKIMAWEGEAEMEVWNAVAADSGDQNLARSQWNDNPHRTHDDVVQLLRRVDAKVNGGAS